jgi:predicted nucleic-acid-binding protein
MIAVDTNVLVRFLVRDDAEQASRADSLIRSEEIWISKTVLLETEWVLRSLYAFRPDSVARAL